MLHHGYVRYWDQKASAPYLYNAAGHIFVSYEDPESLKDKCSYVAKHNLGGVMFWDYAGDPTGALLKTVHDALDPSTGVERGKR
jgi:chitinase